MSPCHRRAKFRSLGRVARGAILVVGLGSTGMIGPRLEVDVVMARTTGGGIGLGLPVIRLRGILVSGSTVADVLRQPIAPRLAAYLRHGSNRPRSFAHSELKPVASEAVRKWI